MTFNRNYVLINADGEVFHGVLYNGKPVYTSHRSMEL